MIDFTSALYLGMRHASRSLQPWSQLTTGVPAALVAPPGTQEVTRELARLQGCERAMLAPSTLHLFWDMFGTLARDRIEIYVDEEVYPIARWGIERAAARGVPVRDFPHFDPERLHGFLREGAQLRSSRRPVIVTDGFCPGCGRAAPLADYLEHARSFDGYLVMDDTQALGIFGHAPSGAMPYGSGGGGMLRWHGVSDARALVISSLAKAFGVPVAALSGSRQLVNRFENQSETRVHCSPPSVAVMHALKHALSLNREHGDTRRLRLARLVNYFRHRLAAAGFSTTGGLFPVQTLAPRAGQDMTLLYEHLSELGIRTVLHRARRGLDAHLSFIITTLHDARQIDLAVNALALAAQPMAQSAAMTT